ESALAALRDAARGDANLLPPIVGAVKAYATVGEICDVLRDEFGEYQPGAAL
ncbi:methylmalonyl-CoA mutase family protein, partial [Halobium palmae]